MNLKLHVHKKFPLFIKDYGEVFFFVIFTKFAYQNDFSFSE